jgi:hypothetical protein
MSDLGRPDLDVAFRCNHCKHRRRLTLEQAYAIFGMPTRIANAQARCRCSRCGEKGARIAPIPRMNPELDRR